MNVPVQLQDLRDADVVQETYRHLRMILIALPALILAGSVLAVGAFGWDSVQGSISAYYLGPMRDVFVGAMVGTAVCLVAYRGAPLEDYALNLAGFYALFVAFVPTQLDQTIAGLKPEAGEELIESLRVTILAVIVVTIVFLVVEWRSGHWAYQALRQKTVTKRFYQAASVLALGFLVLVAAKAFADDSFDGIHLAATLLLIASMATAVASHAWPERAGTHFDSPTFWYRVIFWLMTVGGIVLFTLLELVAHWPYSTIAAEWYEILLFAWFWVIETCRTWRHSTSSAADGAA